jgi:hypothetical protein
MNISPLLKEQLQAEFGEYKVDNVVGTNQMFLRFGYWKRVDVDRLQSIIGDTISVTEDNLDDDDCGTLFSYKLN